jgi:3-hydroxyacyl-CoA dehydrogenase
MAMGPLQMGDMAGLDIGYNIRKQRGWISGGTAARSNPRPARYPEVADVIVAEYKRLGQKSGKVSDSIPWEHEKPSLLFQLTLIHSFCS